MSLYRHLARVYRVLGARFLKIGMNFAGKKLHFLLPVEYADRALYNAEHVLVDCDYFQIREAVPRPGNVVLDIGAFLGFYAVASLALISPGGVVHAVEPNIELIPVLRENLSANKAREMYTYPVAVCPEKGYVKLYIGKYPAVSSFFRDHVERYTEIERILEVKCIKLSSLLRYLGSVDILKLDVEGLEAKILEEALSELWKIRVLVIEVHTDIVDVADVETLLEHSGLKKLVLYASSEMPEQILMYGVR